MEKFFKRVYVRLIELEKKRSWLLQEADIKPSTWSSWEKNRRIPPADRALRIADTLGVSLEFLISGRESPLDLRGQDPLVFEIYSKLGSMKREQLEEVRLFVNTLAAMEPES